MRFQKFIFKGHFEDGEELVFVAHKHWIKILPKVFVLLMFGIILPWAAWLFFAVRPLIILSWNIFFVFWFAYYFIGWYLDALLITNTSVIDVEWVNLFHRKSSRVTYQDLKEMSYEIHGILPTIFRYGTIHVHLNSGSIIDLKDAKRPKRVETIITACKDQFLSKRKMTDATTLQEIISEIVRNHIEENGIPERLKKLGHKWF
ncbi:hypothetical protein HZA38_04845 [Candidatus Peregrinibacteria bacterium]|nr:hypothetical protein [Candidatus Peregrinibacteria bacterium]